jgi:5'-deoxynucleotidase YfbR-like HD superfamily hydrolase
MAKPTHTDIEQLIKTIILPFYHVKRDMPLPAGERRWENDAEHSWSVALLACALAPEVDPQLDLGKIAQYAIAHDLVEVYADDTSTFATEQKLASLGLYALLKNTRRAKPMKLNSSMHSIST